MFLHNLKYELLSGLRSKDLTFWLILFPIILGSFFKIAFSGVYEKDTAFSKIDTAIVMTEEDVTLKSVVDGIEASDQPLMDVTYTNKEEAEKLLKDGDVKGIIYSGEELSLTVTDKGIEQTILSSFVEKYNNRARIIKKTAETDPSAIEKVAAVLSDDVKAANEVPLTEGNTNNLIFYFVCFKRVNNNYTTIISLGKANYLAILSIISFFDYFIVFFSYIYISLPTHE